MITLIHPSWYKLNADEYFILSDRCLKILKSADSETLKLKPLIAILKDAFLQLEQTMVVERGSALTREIAKTDDLRDQCFIAFREYVNAAHHRNKPEWEKPSALLIRIMAKYVTNLNDLNYTSHSSMLTSLLDELERDKEAKAAITTLKLSEWLAELGKAQQRFVNALNVRDLEYAKHEPSHTRAAYRGIRITITDLFNSIELMHKIEPNKGYIALANQLNEVVTSLMTTVISRHTRNNNQKEATSIAQ